MNVIVQSMLTAGLASVAAAVFWLLGWRRRRAQVWLSALGLSAGFMVLYWRTLGRPDFPPIDATQWAFWVALLALPLGWLAGIGAAYRWVWVWGALLGVLWLFVLPFRPLMESGFWTPTVGVAHIVGFGIATWLLMTLSAPLGDEPGAATPFLIATLGGISAGMLFYGGKSASLAQLSGTLGGIVGVAVPLGLLLRGFTVGRGAVTLVMLLLMLLWTTALGFASLTLGQLSLLYLLALTPALYALSTLRRLSPLMRFTLPLAILVVVGGAAVGLQYNAYMSQGGDYYSY
ncbi:MAG: hypothetical protein KatS3mg019_1554 [Fimbriimonadales bacterium]|nr:MAG: hypothetical protein KatS3mg019_1554 [Fimbriimonadales bacterium]